MRYGLNEEVISKINSVFASYPQIKKVILYGSKAKGNYKNGSDIDLALVADEIDFSLLHKIESQLDDLFIPYKIDLSIYNDIKSEELIEHIKRMGIVFYVLENN